MIGGKPAEDKPKPAREPGIDLDDADSGASHSDVGLDAGKEKFIGVVLVVLGSFIGAWWWGIATGHPGPVLAWFGLAFVLAATDYG